METEFTVLVLILFIAGVLVVYAIRVGITPMPTGIKARTAMLACIPDDLTGTVYELGSGWGTLAIPLAEHLPRCRVIGYELSPVPWAVSVLRRAISGLSNVSLRRADFFTADLGNASLVVCYLHPPAMEKLKEKLRAELKPGAMIVSHFFAFRGWPPAEEHTVDDTHQSPVYVYRV